MDEEAFLSKLAAELEIERQRLATGASLDEAWWDSLAIMSAINVIDEQYDIACEPHELIDCRRVADLLEIVRQKIDAKT